MPSSAKTDLIKVLMVGDIVGRPGRAACKEIIPKLRQAEGITLVVANGENVAGGSGITQSTADELFSSGIDVITSGDHIFKRKETVELLVGESRILRPANFPDGTSGSGSYLWSSKDGKTSIGVINAVGRVFLSMLDCPFKRVREEIDLLRRKTNIIVIDFHAEATSEKIAMGWFLDGEVSALAGTHTHVQTADENILPKGTAYITDLGMTGPYESVLGRDIKSVLTRFVKQIPARFEVASGDVRLAGVLVTIDRISGKAVDIKRIEKRLN